MYTSISAVFFTLLVLSPCLGENYYKLLGVEETADRKEIRTAFKKLAVLRHPDKNKDDPEAHEKFVRLTRAYETLKDPTLRKKYDLYGEDGLDNSRKPQTYRSWNYYNNFGIYDDDPTVVTLDENDYLESVVRSEKIWFVNFYSPMCSHCHRIAPIWKKIAKELEGAVRIGAVNCEEEGQLCRQIGIRSYPTLLHFPKNSKEGVRYTGDKSYASIVTFLLGTLDVEIRDVQDSLQSITSGGMKEPALIFLCGKGRDCLSHADRLKVAAVLENTLEVGVLFCDDEQKCEETYSHDVGAVYVPSSTGDSWQAVTLADLSDADALVERVLELLPEPRDLGADDLENIRNHATEGSGSGWLLCFYVGRATELNVILKRLPGIIKGVQLGKINCGRYSQTCASLNVNRYPMWGVIKPGGAFEFNHGTGTINDIVKFFENSMRAKNVWALSAEQVLTILEGKKGRGAWFLDWYAPWCPPCREFLREVRKASLEFDRSIVRFGTIDCTVYTAVCQRYNIRSYPTAMLVNGTDTHQFSVQKTASNIVRFINEARNPSVVRMTSKNFERLLGKRRSGKLTWLVDFFASWCAPCQRLAPEWITVAQSLSKLPFIKVANVDCEFESALCTSQEIRSYPTIRIYPAESVGTGGYAPYSGQRDATSILTWVTNFLPRKVRDLDPSALRTETLADQNLWIVDYFAPWCEHCRKLEPHFSIAAQLLDGKALLGRLNCEMYPSECARAKIKAYPSLMAYDPRHGKKHITAGFLINGTTADALERSVLDFRNRVRHDEL